MQVFFPTCNFVAVTSFYSHYFQIIAISIMAAFSQKCSKLTWIGWGSDPSTGSPNFRKVIHSFHCKIMSSSRRSDMCHIDLDISSDELSESGDLGLGQQHNHSSFDDLESVTSCNIIPTVFGGACDNCSEGTSGYSSVSRTSSIWSRGTYSDTKPRNYSQVSQRVDHIAKHLANFTVDANEQGRLPLFIFE